MLMSISWYSGVTLDGPNNDQDSLVENEKEATKDSNAPDEKAPLEKMSFLSYGNDSISDSDANANVKDFNQHYDASESVAKFIGADSEPNVSVAFTDIDNVSAVDGYDATIASTTSTTGKQSTSD